MYLRYRTLLEQTIDTWEDGYGVVQIVTPEETDDTQLRFCYYKDGEFVNRPLTIAPSPEVAEQTGEVVDTMSSLARTFSPNEIEASSRSWAKRKSSSCPSSSRNSGESRLKEILDEKTD